MYSELVAQLKELGLSNQEIATMYLTSFIISSIITIGLFILKAVAIRTLAKNKGFDKLYLAWIPFLNYVLLGKVVGTCFLFRKKVNNIGVLVAIFSFIGFILSTLLYLLNVVDSLDEISKIFGISSIDFNSDFILGLVNQSGVIYVIVYYVYNVYSIVEILLEASLIYFVFRKYAPERLFLYMLASIFFDFMFGILLFVIRNRKISTYDDFLRTRVRADYSYYDNNGQYGKNPENDPFPEFKKGQEDNLGNKTSGDDDLFN